MRVIIIRIITMTVSVLQDGRAVHIECDLIVAVQGRGLPAQSILGPAARLPTNGEKAGLALQVHCHDAAIGVPRPHATREVRQAGGGIAGRRHVLFVSCFDGGVLIGIKGIVTLPPE
jgi:hypothetical protein